MRRPFGQNYAFVVAGATFAALLVAAGLRAAPGVLMIPLGANFGWSRATISTAAAVGICLYGLVGPFAAALMQTVGIRRTMMGGLALMAASTFASLWMSQPWQYILTWGVISGVGSGAVASVMGAAVVNRWFATCQGLIMGALTASTATGALVFLPFMAWLSRHGAWQPVVWFVCIACAVLIPVVALLVPEHPADIGTERFGATESAPPRLPRGAPSAMLAIDALRTASRSPTFWLLFGTFFVCGLTTNGLVGTHLIAYCGDHGIPPVQAAGLLSLMGLFDLFGTTGSGWLTDRYSSRKLLFAYYTLRGLSLLFLPFTLHNGAEGLGWFAVFYGLDWIATVPPTVRLTTEAFGRENTGVIYGWIGASHQLGASMAAFGAGAIRTLAGDYQLAFWIAGSLCLLAGTSFLTIGRRTFPAARLPLTANAIARS